MLRSLHAHGSSVSAGKQEREQASSEVLPGLYDRMPVLIFINLSVAAFLVGVFLDVVDGRVLASWFALMACLLLARLICWRLYRDDLRRSERSPTWLRVLVVTTALTGAVWGLAGVLFHGEGTAAEDLLLAFAIGGMIAGSAMALTAYLPLFFAFYVPAAVLYAGRLAVTPGHLEMSALVGGFGIGIGLLGRSIHQSLRASEERYRRVVEDQSELICRFRADGTLTFVNGAYAQAFGRAREELVGSNFLLLLPESSREGARTQFTSLTPERPTATYEHRVLLPDGGTAWQQWRDRAIFDRRGRLVELQSVGRDITERKEAEEELRRARDELGLRVERRTRELREANHALTEEVCERRRVEAALRRSEHRLRAALHAARMGVWEQDPESGGLYWSPEMQRLAGLPEASFTGDFEDFLRLVHPDDRDRVRHALAEQVREQPACDLEYRLIRPDGALRWVATFGEPVRDDGRVTRLAGVAMDITDRKLAEEHALRLANHDALTGLPNRRLLEDRLGQAFALAERKGELVAVLILDLDDFKHVNDSRGHPVGDKLLCCVAERLGELVRASDTLARLGGDEFAVVQTGLEDEEGAMVLARKLLGAFERPFVVDDETIHTSTSIGVGLFPTHGSGVAAMLKSADLALYAAKADGWSTICVFQTWMMAQASARQTLEGDLRRALDQDDLILHYQPILHLSSGRITGVEALLRWRRADGSLLPPEGFVPLAERTGLIRPLGERVLKEACRQAADWQRRGQPLRVAVNLSAAQIRRDDEIAAIGEIVDASGIEPRLLEFEVTESVFLDPALRRRSRTLDRLVRLGVRLSVDGFGAGYASLAYLKHFPAHTLKIDRSFIRDLERPDDQAIVKAILSLGRNLARRVVAEGVETTAQMAILHQLGCADMQGFLIGRPQPAAELEQLLWNWPKRWADLQASLVPHRGGHDHPVEALSSVPADLGTR